MIRYSLEGGWFPTAALLLGREGSIIPIGLMVSIPSGLASVFLLSLGDGFHDIFGTDTLSSSQLWAAMVASLTFLIGFRTNKAYGRFWDGTTLLHQMWGEWFDAVSCLVAFSSTAKKSKPVEVADFRHTLVRLMSLCHASALEEIGDSTDGEDGYPTIDLGGLDQNCLKYLKECKFNQELDFNRVEVIIHMIQTLIVSANEAGILKIPPPILSRVFQTISRGQVNLANCKKITSTLFPFPYAQLIAGLLIAFSIMTPCVMASILEHQFWAFVCSTLPIFALWSLNYVAGQLEIPFGADPNDLPLSEFQDHMNKSMLMLIREESDIVPFTCSRCVMDYARMKSSISTKRPKTFIIEDTEDKPMETKDVDAKISYVDFARGAGNKLESPVTAVKVEAPSPAPPVAPPAAAPVPAPATPAPLAADQKAAGQKAVDLLEQSRKEVTVLEQALQKQMSDFSAKLENTMMGMTACFGDVIAKAATFSTQLANGAGTFQDFTQNTSQLSTQLAQTSGAVLELNSACTAVAKTSWEMPKLPSPDLDTLQPMTPKMANLVGDCQNATQAQLKRLTCCQGQNTTRNVIVPASTS